MDIQGLIAGAQKIEGMSIEEVVDGKNDILEVTKEISEYLEKVSLNAVETVKRQMPEKEVVQLINAIKAAVLSDMMLSLDMNSILVLNNKSIDVYTHSIIFGVLGALYEEGIL